MSYGSGNFFSFLSGIKERKIFTEWIHNADISKHISSSPFSIARDSLHEQVLKPYEYIDRFLLQIASQIFINFLFFAKTFWNREVHKSSKQSLMKAFILWVLNIQIMLHIHRRKMQFSIEMRFISRNTFRLYKATRLPKIYFKLQCWLNTLNWAVACVLKHKLTCNDRGIYLNREINCKVEVFRKECARYWML